LKQEVQLQRAKLFEENLRKKQSEVIETLLNETAKEKSARGRIEQLEAAMSDLRDKQIDNTKDYEREQINRANEMETFQKQLTSARNDYERVSKPWRDATRLNDEFKSKITDAELSTQQIARACSDYIDVERILGAFLKPSKWKILTSFGGYCLR
jgi:chromosome segregation ATPase